MKKWLGIALSLAGIGILAWLAFFWRRPDSAPKEKPVLEEEPSGMATLDKVKSFELINARGRVKFARDQDRIWWIVEPVKDMPDPLFGKALLDDLAKLYPRGVIPKSAQEPLSQYGLDKPLATLIFEYDDGYKKVLKIGKKNPAGEALYCLFKDEPDVLLIPARFRMFIQEDPNSYRFRRLIEVKPEQVQEFKMVVLDPQLRQELWAPELRDVLIQTTDRGKAILLMAPVKEKAEGGQVFGILNWMERFSIADSIQDVTRADLASWQLDPPRAYFELIYPDRTQKILVGREKDNLIWLFQEQRMVVLGYNQDRILDFLSRDFRTRGLLTQNEVPAFNRIEVKFPASQKPGYTMEKLDDILWAIDGDQGKKFHKNKVSWITSYFVNTNLDGYINQRPVSFAKYGLQKPELELKFYTAAGLAHEIWIGRWNKSAKRCYVYEPNRDALGWYSQNAADWIPPEGDKFLIRPQERKGR